MNLSALAMSYPKWQSWNSCLGLSGSEGHAFITTLQSTFLKYANHLIGKANKVRWNLKGHIIQSSQFIDEEPKAQNGRVLIKVTMKCWQSLGKDVFLVLILIHHLVIQQSHIQAFCLRHCIGTWVSFLLYLLWVLLSNLMNPHTKLPQNAAWVNPYLL